MDDHTAPPRNPAGHAGLLNNLLALGNSLAGFFESRIGLFASESKAALVHFLVLAGCVLAAGILVALGYVFLLAAPSPESRMRCTFPGSGSRWEWPGFISFWRGFAC